jgi:transcriptional regulator with XRE-family HTH domain
MAKQTKSSRQRTGLYHAREARGMSRTKLVSLSGVSKQQLSRLENGQIRLRLDHLKPFATYLGYTPEQMLLWGRYPGTGAEPSALRHDRVPQEKSDGDLPRQVQELDMHPDVEGRRPKRKLRKGGRHAHRVKSESWVFPPTFIREQLHTSAERLLVIETGHKSPSPDGLYVIRDPFKSIVVKRLQLLRLARPPRVKIISDNPNHAAEEIPLNEVEIVGKVLCYLKLL